MASLNERRDSRHFIHDGTVKNMLIPLCAKVQESDRALVLDHTLTVAWSSKPGPADKTIVFGKHSRLGRIHSFNPDALAFRIESECGLEALVIHADNGKMWLAHP
jgi:hypothetical protein